MADQDILVVTSKIKAFLSAQGFRTDGDLPAALSDKVREMLTGAIEKTKEAKRQTVRPIDL